MSKEEEKKKAKKPTKKVSTKRTKKELIDVLSLVYEKDPEALKSLTKDELEIVLSKAQVQKVKNKKNPNSFFILKDLPAPKTWETKTTSKGGVLVLIAFITVMCIFGGLMFWLAFR